MEETVISGLILAAISGVTFLAYKHHSGYMKIYYFIHYGALLLMLLGFVWNAGVDITWVELSEFIVRDNTIDAIQARDDIKISYIWLVAGGLGVVLYAFFLGHLPWILGKADDSD